ncbi:MAG: hypothetical protein QXL18_02670 [Candidatus Woesearchaeota archaeon]
MSDNDKKTLEEKNEVRKNFFLKVYDRHYKKLMILSFVLLLFSVFSLIFQFATTGDFVNKGITLKGGLTLTFNSATPINSDDVQAYLRKIYPKADINVRSFNELGSYGFVIEASDLSEQEIVSALKESNYVSDFQYNSEVTGPSLGKAFFTQTLKAVFIAFLFMSLIVYLYFGSSGKLKWLAGFLSIVSGMMMFYSNSIVIYVISIIIMLFLMYIYFKDSIPSFAIILCAVSDILFSLSVFNMLGYKLNTAGVAAFLMLIGYSIDTDILLSVRVLKRKDGTIFERIVDAMKTGMIMSSSALIAVLTAYFFTTSSVIKEMMFILAVGLMGDIIFTWIQNAGILRIYAEKKGMK